MLRSPSFRAGTVGAHQPPFWRVGGPSIMRAATRFSFGLSSGNISVTKVGKSGISFAGSCAAHGQNNVWFLLQVARLHTLVESSALLSTARGAGTGRRLNNWVRQVILLFKITVVRNAMHGRRIGQRNAPTLDSPLMQISNTTPFGKQNGLARFGRIGCANEMRFTTAETNHGVQRA